MANVSHANVLNVNTSHEHEVLDAHARQCLKEFMELKDEIRRRREALQMSQAELARKAGTTQQTISRIEEGITKRSFIMSRILRVLQMPDDEAATPTIAAPILTQSKNDLPIYASAAGGPAEMLVEFAPIDYLTRPDPLLNVKDAYGVYVVGESMSPAYEQGDLVLINPHLPVRPGDDVIVFKDHNGDQAAMIKKLVRVTEDTCRLEQHNPSRQFEVSRAEWPRAHVIIGKYKRR